MYISKWSIKFSNFNYRFQMYNVRSKVTCSYWYKFKVKVYCGAKTFCKGKGMY